MGHGFLRVPLDFHGFTEICPVFSHQVALANSLLSIRFDISGKSSHRVIVRKATNLGASKNFASVLNVIAN